MGKPGLVQNPSVCEAAGVRRGRCSQRPVAHQKGDWLKRDEEEEEEEEEERESVESDTVYSLWEQKTSGALNPESVMHDVEYIV